MGGVDLKPSVYRLMNTLLHVKAKGLVLFCFLLFLPLCVFSGGFVLNEEKILDERAAQKIQEIGTELFQKSGVQVYLIVKKSGDGEDIIAYEKNFAKELTPPFALLTLFLEDKKVDIYHSLELEKEFNKEKMLSPLPWSGTIIPLLTGKKKDVSVSAALLNGYADLAEQIADFRKIKLDSAIGSANKNTIGIFRILIYGFLGVMVILMVIKRMKKRV